MNLIKLRPDGPPGDFMQAYVGSIHHHLAVLFM